MSETEAPESAFQVLPLPPTNWLLVQDDQFKYLAEHSTALS